MKTKISKYLADAVAEISMEEFMKLMEIPPEPEMGDYALPCFVPAKKMHKNPALIAEEMKEALDKRKEVLGISKIQTVGAYCNIYLQRECYVKQCVDNLRDADKKMSENGKGKTICMDYSSPNIAKNFHVGHLRTTVIGNSLYKIYEKLGYQVVRINHLGDWGTQFGKLIVAYKLWSSPEEVEKHGIEELLKIYVRFNQEAKQHPELMEGARAWFVKMEENDEEALKIWQWFKDISMVEFERVYDMLKISFDSYLGESFYRDKVPALVKELEEKKLLVESQGAKVIDLEAYEMPPCLIIKSAGGSIYHSRDIAAILYRKQTYDFTKCIYVTGMEQSLHFKQIFKAIEVMGYDWADELVHVPYGLVSLAGEKLSTRSGNIIFAEDILKEAVKRAYAAIEDKNPKLEDKEKVAQMVGIGAIIFHDLFNQRIKNVDFAWEEVLNFDGTTGPYVQYTYARAKSILRKGGADLAEKEISYNALTDDTAYALLKILADYETVVITAAERYEPSVIARYAISLAAAFNRFYHECPILSAESEVKQARLLLTDLVQKTLQDACGLLGMECPEMM